MTQFDKYRFENRPCDGECSEKTRHKIFVNVIEQNGQEMLREDTNAQCTVCRHMIDLKP
ncbi:hypothetical protein SAMN04487966_11728 [Micrococcus terreus]|uniref:Uncharacterized protein n=1 Tax=Micrococcus terreus TaxID=574650 RepID=A0A1I7MSX7_9MICC|nr:hypothetical protein SAMN04487966_11728 [Micrococcus terreus]